MKTSQIIAAIRERCPLFEQRVAGAAEFSVLQERTTLDVPCAFVIPDSEAADEAVGSTGYRQNVRTGFGVVVVFCARADERGQTAMDDVEDIRASLFRALLMWRPDETSSTIEFSGSELLRLDRARVFYQFNFSYRYEIQTEDTWHPEYIARLGRFERVDMLTKGTDGKGGEPTLHSRFELTTTE